MLVKIIKKWRKNNGKITIKPSCNRLLLLVNGVIVGTFKHKKNGKEKTSYFELDKEYTLTEIIKK